MNMIATGNNAKTRVGGLVGLFAGCLIGALSIQGAHAAGGENAPTRVVHYDARSLATDRGVHALYHRLESAAREVCGDDGARLDLSRAAAAHRCSEAALERAVRDIDVR